MPRSRTSAGLLMFRKRNDALEVLLAHPGGPFFKKKDDGAWTIPKGEPAVGEELIEAAIREFAEETGFAPTPPFRALSPIRQKGGKMVHAWAFEGDCDPGSIVCNTVSIEWPPRSGRTVSFPEIDRADFFDLATARLKMNTAQAPFLDELEAMMAS